MKTYTPLFVNGLYVDNMDLFERGKQGHTHLCECRQNHDAFFNRSAFMNHIKLKCHQKWLLALEPPITSTEPPVTLTDVPVTQFTSLEPPVSEEDIPLTLREEQDSEYERSLSKDRQKKIDQQEEEMRRVIQESEEAFVKELDERQKAEDLQRKRNIVQQTITGYSFRFVFPNGKRVSFNIPEEKEISYMRNFIDVYMEDNHNKIEYNLFIYPNKTLDEEDIVKDILENKTTIFIRSLEN